MCSFTLSNISCMRWPCYFFRGSTWATTHWADLDSENSQRPEMKKMLSIHTMKTQIKKSVRTFNRGGKWTTITNKLAPRSIKCSPLDMSFFKWTRQFLDGQRSKQKIMWCICSHWWIQLVKKRCPSRVGAPPPAVANLLTRGYQLQRGVNLLFGSDLLLLKKNYGTWLCTFYRHDV